MGESKVQHLARLGLAGVRLVNGTLGLLAPGVLIGRVSPAQPAAPAATYAFRMFGIRTVLLAVELFTAEGGARRRALRRGVLIHSSDTATAASLALSGHVPARTGALLTTISATNVALALIALGPRTDPDLQDALEARTSLGGLL